MPWLARRLTTPSTLIAGVLVSLVLVLGFAIGAGELLGLAERSDGSTPLDSRITSWVVGHRTAVLTTLARLCSTLGSAPVLLPLVVIIASALLWRREFVRGALLVIAYGGSVLLSNVTKYVVARERPPTDVRLSAVVGSSFPSGHATQSLATYAAIVAVAVALLPRARAPVLVLAGVLAAGVGWSRVYLGVHWSTDVVLGWLIAAAWTAIVLWLAVRAESVYRPARDVKTRGS